MEKNESNPSDLKSYVELFVIVASLLSGSVVFILGINISTQIVAGFIFLLLLIAFLVFRLWRKAQNAYLKNEPLPPPAIFWRILFNKLSPGKGSLKEKHKIAVLVIFDASTEIHYEELKTQFKCTKNDINELQLSPFDWSNQKPDKPLMSALRKSQAVYLFWTNDVANDKNLRKDLDDWSAEETQKPVLVVDKTDQPYDLPFEKVPVEEAGSGLWRLLSKSIERTILWHQQATSYRKIWFVTFFIALGLFIAGSIFFYQNNSLQWQLSKRDQTLPNHSISIARKLAGLREKLTSNVKTNVNSNSTTNSNSVPPISTSEFKNEVQKALNDYADYTYEELMSRFSSENSQGGHISLWRLSPNKQYYQQVARSVTNGEYYRTFKITDDTIVRCAIDKSAFVLWKKEFSEGEEASWNIDGDVIGIWKAQNIQFDPVKYTPATCNRLNIPLDDKTSGILCLGVDSLPFEKNIKNAICIDIPHKNTDFLKTPGARNYLLQTISIMHLIPDDWLKFEPN